MNADESVPVTAAPRDGLAAQLRQLEDFVAQAESEGEELPPEAVEMVARLREIMQALDGLSISFDGLSAAAPTTPATALLPSEPTQSERT
ncbi:MAG: hypothetical protein ABI969_14165 [bacterium]